MTGSRNAILAAVAAVALGLSLQGCMGSGKGGPSWKTNAQDALDAADKQLKDKFTKDDKDMVHAITDAVNHLKSELGVVKMASHAMKEYKKEDDKKDSKKEDDKKDSKKDDDKKDSKKEDERRLKEVSKSDKASQAKAARDKAIEAVKTATDELNKLLARAKKAAARAKKAAEAKEEKKEAKKEEVADKKKAAKEEKKDTAKEEKKDTAKEEKKPKEAKKDTAKEEKKDEKKAKKEAKKDSKGKGEKFLMVDVEFPTLEGNFASMAFAGFLVSSAVLGVGGFLVMRARRFYNPVSTRDVQAINIADDEQVLVEPMCVE